MGFLNFLQVVYLDYIVGTFKMDKLGNHQNPRNGWQYVAIPSLNHQSPLNRTPGLVLDLFMNWGRFRGTFSITPGSRDEFSSHGISQLVAV
jgi:hypothetical protein